MQYQHNVHSHKNAFRAGSRFDFVFVYWHLILVTPDGPRFDYSVHHRQPQPATGFETFEQWQAREAQFQALPAVEVTQQNEYTQEWATIKFDEYE